MRQITLALLATTAVFGLTAGAATAADLPRKAPPPVMAPPPPLWNWTGLYIGGHLGVGISRNQFTQGACDWEKGYFNSICTDVYNADNFGSSSYLGSHNGLGVLGGVQVGYNWQFPNSPIVVGIEGTYSFADLKGDHQNGFNNTNGSELHGQERFASKTSGIATIVARLGLASGPQDRTLWYVKGGGAWANTKFNTLASWNDDSDVRIAAFNGSQKKWGWTVGTGVEWGLFDNWSAKIEYNYADFGTKNVAFAGAECTDPGSCGGVARGIDIKRQIHMVHVGLNYRFNWGR